MTYQTLVA